MLGQQLKCLKLYSRRSRNLCGREYLLLVFGGFLLCGGGCGGCGGL